MRRSRKGPGSIHIRQGAFERRGNSREGRVVGRIGIQNDKRNSSDERRWDKEVRISLIGNQSSWNDGAGAALAQNKAHCRDGLQPIDRDRHWRPQ